MKAKVFIVEDEPSLVTLYETILVSEGFETLDVASNGKEAVEKYKSFKKKPDIIIMDQRMPVMDGIEASKRIKEIDKEARILFVTADALAKIEATSLGVVGFLQKPVSVETLVKNIKNVLEPVTFEKVGKKVEFKEFERGIKLIDEEEAYKEFVKYLRKGIFGLCVTRKYPETLRKDFDLRDIPIIWLSQFEEENVINPSNLPRLIHTIINFIQDNKYSVILLDGLEYLVVQNGFEVVLKYLYSLNDTISNKNSLILIPYNASCFSERELALLERELESKGKV